MRLNTGWARACFPVLAAAGVLLSACSEDVLAQPFDHERGCWQARQVVGDRRAREGCTGAVDIRQDEAGQCFRFFGCTTEGFVSLPPDLADRCPDTAPSCDTCPLGECDDDSEGDAGASDASQ